MTLSNYYSKRREDLEGNQISRNFRLEIDSNDSMNSEKKQFLTSMYVKR